MSPCDGSTKKNLVWFAGKKELTCIESYGLAVEHSAHGRKVVGSIPMLDGNGVKAMPGLIPALNPGSYNN